MLKFHNEATEIMVSEYVAWAEQQFGPKFWTDSNHLGFYIAWAMRMPHIQVEIMVDLGSRRKEDGTLGYPREYSFVWRSDKKDTTRNVGIYSPLAFKDSREVFDLQTEWVPTMNGAWINHSHDEAAPRWSSHT